MSDLQSRFDQAVADSKDLSEKPDTQTMLKLYALYKQSVLGDVMGERPGMTAVVERAKWDVWNELKGRSSESAQKDYIELVAALK